jgi:hypothetical protein
VIGVSRHAVFFAPTLLEKTLRGLLCALRLKPGSDALVAMPQPSKLAAGVRLARAIRRDVFDPEVHAEPVLRRSRRRFLYLGGGKQIPLAIPADEIGLAAPMFQKFARPIVANERNRLAFLDSPNGDGIGLPREDAVIVRDGPERA